MSKVFQVRPKRIKRSNGTVLTPDMVVTVTTQQHTTTPFYNGAKELQEVYMRIYAAENGGYPPTQNGDIRSLFWLFSLMALQN